MTIEAMQQTNTDPWYAGMKNLVRRELFHERTRMYWTQQMIIWALITNGMVALILTLPGDLVGVMMPVYTFSLVIFYNMLSFLIILFIPILLQGVVIDEKVTGIAAWILSKPVSKKAYLISKMITSILPIILVSVVINGAIGYGVFVVFGYTPNAVGFAMNLGLTGVVVAYFASLTIMVGTITTSRGKVLAAAIGLGVGANILANFFPLIMFIVPYALPLLGLGLITGDAVMGIDLILISACVQIALFTTIALFVFERTEM